MDNYKRLSRFTKAATKVESVRTDANIHCGNIAVTINVFVKTMRTLVDNESDLGRKYNSLLAVRFAFEYDSTPNHESSREALQILSRSFISVADVPIKRPFRAAAWHRG